MSYRKDATNLVKIKKYWILGYFLKHVKLFNADYGK